MVCVKCHETALRRVKKKKTWKVSLKSFRTLLKKIKRNLLNLVLLQPQTWTSDHAKDLFTYSFSKHTQF